MPSLISRLDALLLVLKTCRGNTCIQPWRVLHPDGEVSDLTDALREEYDFFYEQEQQKVSFSRCEKGYILDAEGPLEALVYRGKGTDGKQVGWSEFV